MANLKVNRNIVNRWFVGVTSFINFGYFGNLSSKLMANVFSLNFVKLKIILNKKIKLEQIQPKAFCLTFGELLYKMSNQCIKKDVEDYHHKPKLKIVDCNVSRKRVRKA